MKMFRPESARDNIGRTYEKILDPLTRNPSDSESENDGRYDIKMVFRRKLCGVIFHAHLSRVHNRHVAT